MATLENIETFEAKIPLGKPLAVGAAKITHRTYTIVKVTSSEGQIGVGYCYSRGLPMKKIIDEVMSPIAIGSELISMESIVQLSQKILAFNWQSAEHGTLTAALSAIDVALHDLLAKKLRKSVASMLGATAEQIPVYSVIGYEYGLNDLEFQKEVDYALSRGIHSFKIIIGGDSPERDMQRIKLLRETSGPDVLIGADAFRTFKTLDNAITRVNLIKDFNISFIEDPFLESEGIISGKLRDATGVPVSYGESLASSKMVAQILDHNECDILRIDALVIGGVGEFLAAAKLAEKHGKSYSTHIHTEIHSQLAGATNNLYQGGLEYLDPINEIDLFHQLLHKPIQIENGNAIISKDPGFGIDWDWQRINFFSADKK